MTCFPQTNPVLSRPCLEEPVGRREQKRLAEYIRDNCVDDNCNWDGINGESASLQESLRLFTAHN